MIGWRLPKLTARVQLPIPALFTLKSPGQDISSNRALTRWYATGAVPCLVRGQLAALHVHNGSLNALPMDARARADGVRPAMSGTEAGHPVEWTLRSAEPSDVEGDRGTAGRR